MTLQSFLEAPEPSRAEERSQYSIPNTSKLPVSGSPFNSVRDRSLNFYPYCYAKSAIFVKGDRTEQVFMRAGSYRQKT
ncbi:hypothetical protein QUA27_06740 [Microcoleus sp. Pol14C6]|uniref:hypothetical protein n=1 Tax=unclassified Microcoleus TaxID=2642155 RepID=UPI002FCFAF13